MCAGARSVMEQAHALAQRVKGMASEETIMSKTCMSQESVSSRSCKLLLFESLIRAVRETYLRLCIAPAYVGSCC